MEAGAQGGKEGRREESDVSVEEVKAAERKLAKLDPVLARLIADAGPCTLGTPTAGTTMVTLARAIVFQQLAGRAASVRKSPARVAIRSPESSVP